MARLSVSFSRKIETTPMMRGWAVTSRVEAATVVSVSEALKAQKCKASTTPIPAKKTV